MNSFRQLAARVTRGDPDAACDLREDLEVRMIPMIRRTVRRGAGGSLLEQRILAEARRLAVDERQLTDEERERRIARRLCESVVGNLRPRRPEPPRLADTVPA